MMELGPAARWFQCAFSAQANGFAAMYGGPLFLVGSALWLERPGDFDVRVLLLDHDFDRLFGDGEDRWWPDGAPHPQPTARGWRRFTEELKQSRRLARVYRQRIDLQFQTFEQFWKQDGPRLRLDTCPPWFFLAGLTDA